jgi:hypothetical protein
MSPIAAMLRTRLHAAGKYNGIAWVGDERRPQHVMCYAEFLRTTKIVAVYSDTRRQSTGRDVLRIVTWGRRPVAHSLVVDE